MATIHTHNLRRRRKLLQKRQIVYIWNERQKVPASAYCKAHRIIPTFRVVDRYVKPVDGFYYHFK